MSLRIALQKKKGFKRNRLTDSKLASDKFIISLRVWMRKLEGLCCDSGNRSINTPASKHMQITKTDDN